MTRRQKRLLLLSTAGNIGGTERVVLTLAREFTRRGWHADAIFAPDPASESMLAWARTQGVEAETHPAVVPMSSPRSVQDVIALWRLVRARRPDVVNIHYGGNHLSAKDVLAVRAAGTRCVINAHLPTPWDDYSNRKKRATHLAAALSHRVVAHSRQMRDVLMQAGIPARRIAVVNNGVPVPSAPPCAETARESLGLPLDAFIVGSMGRLAPIKNTAGLIDAVAQLPNTDRQSVLVIAGDGPDRFDLERRADELMPGRVRFLGLADPSRFFPALDVFALASTLEGLPMTFLEASMYGVPCVGTDVGGVAEAIEHEVTGLLVPVHDTQAITRAIARFRDDPIQRSKMGAAAAERARVKFSETSMADGYERIFA
jgi:glycosyltransferase involved in cell wall biosynthesis